MNFQVTVLKILVSYPDGFALMEDLKRDMAILATSGREWADRTRRLAARIPDLNIFSQALVERISGGWRITSKSFSPAQTGSHRPSGKPTRLPQTGRRCIARPALRRDVLLQKGAGHQEPRLKLCHRPICDEERPPTGAAFPSFIRVVLSVSHYVRPSWNRVSFLPRSPVMTARSLPGEIP